MPDGHRLGVCFWALLAVPASGCGDPASPTALDHTRAAAVHSNAERYRDSAAAATGRSGSAAIQMLALQAKDGTTDLILTTGQLSDPSAAPGWFKHIQIKTLADDGRVLATSNRDGLPTTGTVDLALQGAVRGQTIQVQALVVGIDGTRTDVVTVTDRVRLRPDLAVVSLDVPAQASVATDVTMAAVVSELNGDVGATADCVLSVDGQEVDRASRIWVDAGGTVTCRFAYRFSAAGTHTVEVALVNVDPADWDTGNNAKSASIAIDAGAGGIRYDVSAFEERFSSSTLANGYATASATTPDLHIEESQVGWQQRRTFNGRLDTRLRFPLARLSVQDATDGTALDTLLVENLAAMFSSGDAANGSDCAFSQGGSPSFFVCGSSSGSSLQVLRDAGDVTYHSEGFSRQFNWYFAPNMHLVGDFWVWNNDTRQTWGSQGRLGASYQVQVAIVDATGTSYGAEAQVPLTPFQGGFVNGELCTPWMAGRYCSSSSFQFDGVSGEVIGP
jgi:hypothetical protein